ncbi:hypothetical protein MYCTH_2314130 [Thermothelomyces thermophilus ATCC 42464]|uniref:Ubiquitin carrier protein n=1 Tax=Thermothelomyces thermophilus (strain ATCC 42464 / BCRC 31852 / DSM 1799) TaxID=573729 RepID=G2Q2K8_THET4|nr:uncharacterized protein MYCTH_2314130 [Thermothelomyces thermophilus ATCC 42464]AEO55133.1 hypothetical protein MYCTH_2314130 [Thermothelomyces thermophilus ATCC 42464]
MLQTLAFGGTLAKRLVEDAPQTSQPPVALYFLGVANLVVFLPVLLVLFYTFQYVYPTLAAVEDPLPAYEALAMNDDDGQTKNGSNTPMRTAQPGMPITASIRATNRLIRSLNGWLSNFRGLGYSVLIGILTGLTTLFFGMFGFIPRPVAHLLALVIVAPLSTTWTHLVVTRPSAKSFARRIPALKKVYRATWLPTFLLWAATNACVYFPILLAGLIGLELSDPERPDQIRSQLPTGSDAGKALAVLGLLLGLQVLLYIPAETALTRVQASLLPPDEDTVVPFDRSFAGRVEPELVTGKGFATFGAAIKSVTRASWVRIYLQRLKLCAVSMAIYFAVIAVVMVEALIVTAIQGSQ